MDKELTAQLRNLARKIGVFTTDIQLSEYDPIYVCVINARTNSAVFEHCVFKKSLQGVNVIFNYDVVTRTHTVSFYSRANNCKNGYALQYLKALVTSYTAQGKKVISYGGHPNACGAVVEDITAFLFNHLTVVDKADLCK